jgi:Zn-dependent protease with chaperone function
VADGFYYDGSSAVRHRVEIEPAGEAVRIVGQGFGRTIAASRLQHLDSRKDAEIYGEDPRGGWRLGIRRPVPSEIAALLPRRRVYGGWIDRIGLLKAVIIAVVLSAAVILFGQLFPHWVAPLVPKSWERSFGDALVGDFGQKFCAAPGGQAALDRMTARLGARPGEVRLRVVNVPIVNAAALPGGTIVIFDELIHQAGGPDEVAGVLAHEIAHVRNRDVTEVMIRQLGFSLILSSLGGTTGGNVELLMGARYSRGAEARADADAIAALRSADVSPRATARFFERLARIEGSVPGLEESLSYLSSHPLSGDRRRAFERAAVKGRTYRPSLSEKEWTDLKGICRGTEAVDFDPLN